MSSNTRFTVAIHTLALLALKKEEAVTSEYVASSVNTNPVVIRRVLGRLRAAGLVTSHGGNGGGWRLAVDPQGITLCDIYSAVEDEPLFALHHRLPSQNCPVGRNIQSALEGRFREASQALQDRLARTTLAAVLDDVLARAG